MEGSKGAPNWKTGVRGVRPSPIHKPEEKDLYVSYWSKTKSMA